MDSNLAHGTTTGTTTTMQGQARLARGRLLAGGLPLARPDLHFLSNLAETAPLLLAFFHQVGEANRNVAARARRQAPMDYWGRR